jgi:hypothetical protein
VASWGEIERIASQLARLARSLLDAHVHKTPATVRVTRLTEAKDEPAIDFWSEAGGARSPTRR